MSMTCVLIGLDELKITLSSGTGYKQVSRQLGLIAGYLIHQIISISRHGTSTTGCDGDRHLMSKYWIDVTQGVSRNRPWPFQRGYKCWPVLTSG